ncbi:MAG TPA: hypothetical protein VNK67_02565 [Burkholderiales bacterium]|nr:hypothetical protein [Burkholderiales bacterium]
MRSAQRADFLFIGLAVLPLALAFGDYPELALLSFVPLLLAACFAGMWEQIETCCGGAEKADREEAASESPEEQPPTLGQKP